MVSNEYGEWIGSYTKIEFEKEYKAIGEQIYLSFDQKDSDNCKRKGGLFYCDNMLLLKHISEHTCASVIYMNKTELVKMVCLVKYLEGYRPKPQIVETSRYILMIGIQTPWNLYCNQALDIPVSTSNSSHKAEDIVEFLVPISFRAKHVDSNCKGKI